MRYVIFVIFYTCIFDAFSQDITYARKIIDTLTSPYFEGRGAINNGERKAAEFIAKEYEKFDLASFDASYFQSFNYPINTFPGKLFVQLDETTLIAGEDYIIGGQSSKIKGTFKLKWYNKENFPSKERFKKLLARQFFTDKFIVIDNLSKDQENELLRYLKGTPTSVKGIIFLEEKLTQSLATHFVDYAIVKVKKEKMLPSFKSITLTINQTFIPEYPSQNVIGYLEGTAYPDSFIVLSAHYDHLGKMGDEVYFPGANDNASGTAMLLNLAKYYNKHPPKKSLVFIAFGAEEAGIIGSQFFVQHPLFDLRKLNFVFNMDIMGTGDEGATVVNANILPRQFELLETINEEKNYLTTIKKRGEAANSDHYWFTKKKIPAFFMYTLGGIQAYHDVNDISETLPLTKFEDCFRLICDFIAKL